MMAARLPEVVGCDSGNELDEDCVAGRLVGLVDVEYTANSDSANSFRSADVRSTTRSGAMPWP